MIQFNLLPDVKVQYIKTQRTKRMVLFTSLIVAAISLLILFMTFSYNVAQKKHLSNLNKDIKSIRTELESNKELTKMLSVQNQLNSLPSLYAGRPAADRLPKYMEQTTPSNVYITKMNIDFSTSTMSISGTAASLSAVNTYIDTLKYTKFKTEPNGNESLNAYKDVVMSKFGNDKGKTTYTLTLGFDPKIYDNSVEVKLEVPNTVTTYAQQVENKLFDGGDLPTGENQ